MVTRKLEISIKGITAQTERERFPFNLHFLSPMKLLKIQLEMHVLIGAFESTLELLGFYYLYVNTELGLSQSSY